MGSMVPADMAAAAMPVEVAAVADSRAEELAAVDSPGAAASVEAASVAFAEAMSTASGAATEAAVIILAVVGTADRASILDSAVTRITATATDTVTRITDTIPM